MRVVLIVVDSLRADAPGDAGGFCRTPTLDRFASEGITFRRCFSAAPWTVPSLTAMFTGAFAHRAGVYRWDQRLPAAFPSIFQAARGMGYRVASFVFDPAFLLSASPEASVAGTSQRIDDVVDWLQRCPDRDLFVFVHIWSTHFPYVERPMTAGAWDHVAARVLQAMNANPGATRAKVRALYQRAVEHMSESVLPRLIAAARGGGGEDDTLIILTGDHGETWGDRDVDQDRALRDVFDLHGNHLRDEALTVPLILWAPGRIEPALREDPVRTVDIAPTILHLMGDPEAFEGEGELAIDGHTLLPGQPSSAASPIVACQSYNLVTARVEDLPDHPRDVWRTIALRTTRWKYSWEPATSLRWVTDLQSDPYESKRLPCSAAPDQGWQQLEAQWDRATCAPKPDAVETRLRKLGYLS